MLSLEVYNGEVISNKVGTTSFADVVKYFTKKYKEAMFNKFLIHNKCL